MTLAQAPADSYFHVATVRDVEKSDLNFIRMGLASGKKARLICRHPERRPAVFEVLLDNSVYLSVPALLANRIEVRLVKSDENRS